MQQKLNKFHFGAGIQDMGNQETLRLCTIIFRELGCHFISCMNNKLILKQWELLYQLLLVIAELHQSKDEKLESFAH